MKRIFDIIASALGLLLLSPLLLILALLVVSGSQGGAFYRQTRVGKDARPFTLYKFRSMRPASDQQGLLTVGARDNRITRTGYFLRKYKLDELPQLWNVLRGDMSLVGPRPEVPRYIDMLNEEQRRILSVRPGLTDYASLEYFEEDELLAQSDDPEKTYIREILPTKVELSLRYIDERSFSKDLQVIWKTVKRVVS
jgi:lipopolysaccharide/colanic/teichoic acid biosynthesis glycosyltransferase